MKLKKTDTSRSSLCSFNCYTISFRLVWSLVLWWGTQEVWKPFMKVDSGFYLNVSFHLNVKAYREEIETFFRLGRSFKVQLSICAVL